MKKLMIMLGLVAMAAVSAQASKVKWSATGVTPYGTDEDTSDYYMACFCAESTVASGLADVYTSVADATKWAQSKGATEDGVNILKEAYFGGEASKTSLAYTQSAWVSTAAQDEVGKFFAVIFNSDDVSTATAYMITEVKDLTFAISPTENQTVTMAAGEWQSIPEPTSGLLLLIGVAGLALRRRRA